MTRLKSKLKMWNKGGFNFWLVGLNYMRRRDAVMGRFLTRSEEKLERRRIIKLLENNGFTAASELIEQDAIRGEQK